jgi:hypothetical protein
MKVTAVEKALEDLGPDLTISDDLTVVSDRRDAGYLRESIPPLATKHSKV